MIAVIIKLIFLDHVFIPSGAACLLLAALVFGTNNRRGSSCQKQTQEGKRILAIKTETSAGKCVQGSKQWTHLVEYAVVSLDLSDTINAVARKTL